MPLANSQPTVAIVLCTFNGAKHLQAQLESLNTQTWPISVLAFDDGSTDSTIEILESYKDRLNISIHRNEKNLGYVSNFEQGIAKALDSGFDYIALCDQDDLWHQQRVTLGMQQLQTMDGASKSKPALVHCDLNMINATGETVHHSFLTYRRYSIGEKNALATVLGQNGVMGNTILMNAALAKLALPFPADLHVHDYWLAVLVELYGQRVLLDKALVNYRIHDSNASNPNAAIKFGLEKHIEHKSWQGFITRDYRLPFKEDARLNVINTILDDTGRLPRPTPQQSQTLGLFRDYLEFSKPRYQLLYGMLKGGFYRKGFKHRIRVIYSTLFTARYNT